MSHRHRNDTAADAATINDAAGVNRKLVDNIVYFARLLRHAGLPVGPGAAVRAAHALQVAGVRNREDVYWSLHCVFVSRSEHRAVFAESFRLFFRKKGLIEKLLALLSPSTPGPAPADAPNPGAARVQDALFAQQPATPGPDAAKIEIDARMTMSSRERLGKKDFEQITADEFALIKQHIARLHLPDTRLRSRRLQPHARGTRIDMRRTLRHALRTGGHPLWLKKLRAKPVHPPVVALCDISGSMTQYTRVFLHFLHALGTRNRRVHTFVFGTRLTNVTRALRHRDPDEALTQCNALVEDWSGGTRIGTSLKHFNRDWSRRVLGQGALVLLMTDGLERDPEPGLAFETDRLRRSCRRLIWLNPLLRYEAFAARAHGVRAMLAHVDEFRPIHSLDNIAGLVQALSASGAVPDPKLWLREADCDHDR